MSVPNLNFRLEGPDQVCIIGDESGVFAHHVGSNESMWLHIGADRAPSDYQVRKHSGNQQEYIRDTVDGTITWASVQSWSEFP